MEISGRRRLDKRVSMEIFTTPKQIRTEFVTTYRNHAHPIGIPLDTRRADRLIVSAALFAVSLAFRLISIGQESFFYDEGVTLWACRRGPCRSS